MMAQESLPFARGSATSKAAAESMRGKAAAIRRDVLALVVAAGEPGITCDEAEAKLGGSHQSISPRFTELVASGEIVRTTDKRPTRSGHKAFVYRAAR